jgi:hypothetical protein
MSSQLFGADDARRAMRETEQKQNNTVLTRPITTKALPKRKLYLDRSGSEDRWLNSH